MPVVRRDLTGELPPLLGHAKPMFALRGVGRRLGKLIAPQNESLALRDNSFEIRHSLTTRKRLTCSLS